MGSIVEQDFERCTIEEFSPILNEQYSAAFNRLLLKIDAAYNGYRRQVIMDELQAFEQNIEESGKLDLLRYLASLNILLDLLQQGWVIHIENSKLYLKLYNNEANDKEHVRYRLNSERMAQFDVPSIKRFIKSMERTRQYGQDKISIINLIGDPALLLRHINEGLPRVVAPYIQLATNERDELTGFKLFDIWRYFRYTWSIPYKSVPGRNLFYLVRDAAQPYHPVMGIFALGNAVLNVTVRDDDIGWTISAIKKSMQRMTSEQDFSQLVSQTNGKKVAVKSVKYLETEDEHQQRISAYAERLMRTLTTSLSSAISDIYVKDLGYHRQTKFPSEKKIAQLREMAEALREQIIDNKKNAIIDSWELEAQSKLFKKKRALELARLLDAKRIIMSKENPQPAEWLAELLRTEQGRTAIYTALIANRKSKIGSNMMEIIVCGAIPPYNELLGGKLISILASSPQVVYDYTKKYQNQVSEIASRMKGKRVVRDSRLAYLSTTSLYSVNSSQYNRIKVKRDKEILLEFKRLGTTEGFGSIYFSQKTTGLFSQILQLQDGGKKINHVFGEGTSPRFRLISKGLSTLGIRSEAFLRHYSPRIVYAIELAENSKDFLMGYTDELIYRYNLDSLESVKQETEELIEFWYHRWLESRLTSVDINARLGAFVQRNILLSKFI